MHQFYMRLSLLKTSNIVGNLTSIRKKKPWVQTEKFTGNDSNQRSQVTDNCSERNLSRWVVAHNVTGNYCTEQCSQRKGRVLFWHCRFGDDCSAPAICTPHNVHSIKETSVLPTKAILTMQESNTKADDIRKFPDDFNNLLTSHLHAIFFTVLCTDKNLQPFRATRAFSRRQLYTLHLCQIPVYGAGDIEQCVIGKYTHSFKWPLQWNVPRAPSPTLQPTVHCPERIQASQRWCCQRSTQVEHRARSLLAAFFRWDKTDVCKVSCLCHQKWALGKSEKHEQIFRFAMRLQITYALFFVPLLSTCVLHRATVSVKSHRQSLLCSQALLAVASV